MVTDGVHQLSIRLVGDGPYGVRLSGGDREPLTVAKVRDDCSDTHIETSCLVLSNFVKTLRTFTTV